MERLNTTLDAFTNSSDARKLVQAHILPDRPWHTKLLPLRTIAIPCLGPSGAYVTISVVDVGQEE